MEGVPESGAHRVEEEEEGVDDHDQDQDDHEVVVVHKMSSGPALVVMMIVPAVASALSLPAALHHDAPSLQQPVAAFASPFDYSPTDQLIHYYFTP